MKCNFYFLYTMLLCVLMHSNVPLVDEDKKEAVYYQFPIPTVEYYKSTMYTKKVEKAGLGESVTYEEVDLELMSLSSDLGITPFHAKERGSELNRWIQKAFDKGEFIRIS